MSITNQLRFPCKRVKHTVTLFIKVLIIVSMIYYIFLHVNGFTTSFMHKLYRATGEDFGFYYNRKANEPNVPVVGINQKASRLDMEAQYVFVLPKKTEEINCQKQPTEICNGVQQLIQILNEFPYFDGGTCRGLNHIVNFNYRQRLRSCRFEAKHRTMLINQSSDILQYHRLSNLTIAFTICNIVEGPFVIRRSVLDGLGFRPSHGEATLLDFFLRSNGTLKIVSSHNCSFLEQQLVPDRGAMANKEVYLDYGLLGYHHDILRVVRDTTITWTQCTKNTFLCPDKPLRELGQPKDRELYPYCCNERLDQYLTDVILAFKEMNMDYRLCGGTVLGAVRTKAIIPWTYDIDICIRSTDYRNSRAFFQMEKFLRAKRYSSPLIFNLRRVMPMYPLTKNISSNSLKEYNLYDKKILEMMEYVLPIEKPKWSSMGYVDIYPIDEMFDTKPSNIIINGNSYLTCGNPHSYLLKSFGESYNQVDYTYKSKDPHKLWVFWKWEASLNQEDTPTEWSDNLVGNYVIVIGVTLCLFVMFKLCQILTGLYWHRRSCWNILKE